jgi:uncharacterized protein (TIGR03000 family)
MSAVLSRGRSVWAWVALLLAAGPAAAQGVGYPAGPPLTYSFGTPYAPFASPYYPYATTAPSPYGGGLQTYTGIGSTLKPLTSPFYSPAALGSTLAPVLNESGAPPQEDNRARIWLRVPADAAVWFEGIRTRQTGTQRYFFSPPLAPGVTYAYDVEARWEEDGKPVERKRQLLVHAGDSLRVDLTQPAASRNTAGRQAGKE